MGYSAFQNSCKCLASRLVPWPQSSTSSLQLQYLCQVGLRATEAAYAHTIPALLTQLQRSVGLLAEDPAPLLPRTEHESFLLGRTCALGIEVTDLAEVPFYMMLQIRIFVYHEYPINTPMSRSFWAVDVPQSQAGNVPVGKHLIESLFRVAAWQSHGATAAAFLPPHRRPGNGAQPANRKHSGCHCALHHKVAPWQGCRADSRHASTHKKGCTGSALAFDQVLRLHAWITERPKPSGACSFKFQDLTHNNIKQMHSKASVLQFLPRAHATLSCL